MMPLPVRLHVPLRRHLSELEALSKAEDTLRNTKEYLEELLVGIQEKQDTLKQCSHGTWVLFLRELGIHACTFPAAYGPILKLVSTRLPPLDVLGNAPETSCNSTTPMIHEDRNPELETYASFEQELVESLVID
ncbi:hypothetical protein H0H81_004275 [Sphagnurus paluster]|uniref:Uncharacterized protein n=1 Tax=Sphagnurus paluster TaxID=117069 RepID=A0A9P7FPP1_9AGAR|nr:hypothetical protein H0H81_004275 [Sphagnurus paluster]